MNNTKDICLRLEAFDYAMLYRYAGMEKCSIQELIRRLVHEGVLKFIDAESHIETNNLIDITLDSGTTIKYDTISGRYIF